MGKISETLGATDMEEDMNAILLRRNGSFQPKESFRTQNKRRATSQVHASERSRSAGGVK
jgi:hypothetical protein